MKTFYSEVEKTTSGCYDSFMNTTKLLIFAIATSVVLASCVAAPNPTSPTTAPTAAEATASATPLAADSLPSQTPSPTQTAAKAVLNGPLVEVVANNLITPWEIAFLPDGRLLVTERPGTLALIGTQTERITVPGVSERGEGGLLGLALDPDFVSTHRIFLYLTTTDGGRIANRVESYTLQEGALSDRAVVLDDIPGADYHDGGRIEFGPDGTLYITTGDAQDQPSAQDHTNLQGKILRINKDGSIPEGNPFSSAVWSFGHRNPQGLAWDSEGRLWSTEHGPSGDGSGYDELNLISPGANYGWPVIQGDQTQPGMQPPVIQSGGNETWAPGDVEYLNGKLYFTGLRGSSLYVVSLDGETITDFFFFCRRVWAPARHPLGAGWVSLYLHQQPRWTRSARGG